MSKSVFQKLRERNKSKKELKELFDLYRIFSPSFNERELSLYVQGKLKKAGVKFELLENQIYSLKEGKPLLSAHMDQVSTKPITKIYTKKGKIKADGNLGADDKNGVWILLQLIRKYPEDVSFIFSTGEETVTQCDIGDFLSMYEDFIKEHIPYSLVFDRRGTGDIIGEYNDYCTQEFEDDVSAAIGHLGYEPTMGVFSDADTISDYISCVNLSCGFYMAHSEKEYTKIKDLYKALRVGEVIIKEVTQYYSAPEKTYSSSWWRSDTGTSATKTESGWVYDDDLYHVWYCPVCEQIYLEEYLKDIDVNENFICEDSCAAKLIYYGQCYDYELERLFDGDVPLSPEGITVYESAMFCPVCGWFSYTTREMCADCGVNLLPTTPDGYEDEQVADDTDYTTNWHDQILKEM